MKVSAILGMLPGELVQGAMETSVSGFASLADAKAGDLSFFGDPRYSEALANTLASVILIPEGWTRFPEGASCIAVSNPSEAFSILASIYNGAVVDRLVGIHPSAVVSVGVVVDPDQVHIGPNAVIEDGVHLGDGSSIGAGCFVGRNARIGKGCKLYANASVHERCTLGDRVILHSGVVVGADGFGYRFENGRHLKVPQTGIVQIDDDVEIGANTTIDRARIGKTWIGEGTKIDNLVQIGHNAVLGKHCIVISQSGIAGSSTIGNHVIVAAQAGITGHVSVGSGCTIGARSVVSKNLPDGRESYLGFPAVPAMQERRRMVASKKLPEMLNRIRSLEEEIKKIAGAFPIPSDQPGDCLEPT